MQESINLGNSENQTDEGKEMTSELPLQESESKTENENQLESKTQAENEPLLKEEDGNYTKVLVAVTIAILMLIWVGISTNPPSPETAPVYNAMQPPKNPAQHQILKNQSQNMYINLKNKLSWRIWGLKNLLQMKLLLF